MASSLRDNTFFVLRQLTVVSVVIALLHGTSRAAELIYTENFETGDSRYEILGESFTEVGDHDGSPGVWGLSTNADQIGLISAAPARRAAIQWSHIPFVDDFTDEAYQTWVPLVDWAAGVTTDDERKDARVGFLGGYFEESVEGIRNALVDAGYADDNVFELLDAAEIEPDELEAVIHSSVQESNNLAPVAVPIISFAGPSHDDTAIAGIGGAVLYDGEVELEIPDEHKDHPALGGLGAAGTIPWTTGPNVELQNMGKLHNGGTAIAFAEDPVTGDPAAAIFVIEEGAPVLGSFNPEPEGDTYFVGSALNKHGPVADGEAEAVLALDPINVAGKDDLRMTVKLAATAADFENGDYLRIEVSADGDDFEILDEFWGTDDAGDCQKGLSNGDPPGSEGDICLANRRVHGHRIQPAECVGAFHPIRHADDLGQ